jgi:apolipoprotein N-acyltransferase
MPGSFGMGDGPHTFAIPGAPPAGPLICYEILFPGAVVGNQRPQWLVNVTDDSWFGPPSSSGPRQHLLIARVRAIEEGLPIARDANTGITAVIDPLGRLLGTLASGQTGVLDSDLPQAVPETIFARYGESLFLALLFICLVTGVFAPGATLGRPAR